MQTPVLLKPEFVMHERIGFRFIPIPENNMEQRMFCKAFSRERHGKKNPP
jgi:hypothetical protein